MTEPPAFRVLVTRPREDAEALAAELAQHNIEPVLAPVNSVEYIDVDIEDAVGRSQGILFTSRNGVRAFCRLTQDRRKSAYTVGNATAGLAREEGFEDVHSAVGDGAALVGLVVERLDPGSGPLFHAAGEKLAVDIAAQLSEHGFETMRYNLYRTRPVDVLPAGISHALTECELDCVLHFSQTSARTFSQLAAAAGVEAGLSGISAVCLSDAVAAGLNTAAWREIHVASRPDAGAVIDLLQRLASGTIRSHTESSPPETESGQESGEYPESEPDRSPPQESVPKDARIDTASETHMSDQATRKQFEDHVNANTAPATKRSGQRTVNYGLAIVAGVILIVLTLAGNYFLSSIWQARLTEETAQAVGSLRQQLEAAQQAEAETQRLSIEALARKVEELETGLAAARNETDTGLSARISSLEKAFQETVQRSTDQVSKAEFTALSNRVDNAESAVRSNDAEVVDRLTELESKIQALVNASRNGDLSSELTALNDRVAQVQKTLNTVQQSLSALRHQADNLETQHGQAITELNNATGRLKAAVGELDTDIQALKKSVLLENSTRTALSAARLGAALAGSAPFMEELAAFRSSPPNDRALNALVAKLEPFAQSGVPSRADLLAQLPRLLETAVSINEEPPSQQSPGWLDLAAESLREVVTVRRRAADDHRLALKRARAAAENGDLAEAVNALSDADMLQAEALSRWLNAARSRLEAHEAILAIGRFSQSALATESSR